MSNIKPISIKKACEKYNLNYDELCQAMIEGFFPAFHYFKPTESTKFVRTDANGDLYVLKDFAVKEGYCKLDNDAVACVLSRQRQLVSSLIYEDFHLQNDVALTIETIRLNESDLEKFSLTEKTV